jgi:hypothetical protein
MEKNSRVLLMGRWERIADAGGSAMSVLDVQLAILAQSTQSLVQSQKESKRACTCGCG